MATRQYSPIRKANHAFVPYGTVGFNGNIAANNSAPLPSGGAQSFGGLEPPDLGPPSGEPYFGVANYGPAPSYDPAAGINHPAGQVNYPSAPSFAWNGADYPSAPAAQDYVTPNAPRSLPSRIATSLGRGALRQLTFGLAGQNPTNPIIGTAPNGEPVYEGKLLPEPGQGLLSRIYQSFLNGTRGATSPQQPNGAQTPWGVATPNNNSIGGQIPTNGQPWSYGGTDAPVGSIVGADRNGRPIIQGPNGQRSDGGTSPGGWGGTGYATQAGAAARRSSDLSLMASQAEHGNPNYSRPDFLGAMDADGMLRRPMLRTNTLNAGWKPGMNNVAGSNIADISANQARLSAAGLYRRRLTPTG